MQFWIKTINSGKDAKVTFATEYSKFDNGLIGVLQDKTSIILNGEEIGVSFISILIKDETVFVTFKVLDKYAIRPYIPYTAEKDSYVNISFGEIENTSISNSEDDDIE